jgi:hypothetical protein
MNQRLPFIYPRFASIRLTHIEIKYSLQDVIGKYVDSFQLAYITSRQSAVIAGCRAMKDLRRLRLIRFFRVRRRFFAISKPSGRRSVGIDIPGRLGNSGDARVVLEMVGRSDEGPARLLAELFETSSPDY